MNRRWWWIMPILIFVVLVVWALWRRGWDRTIFTVLLAAIVISLTYHAVMYYNKYGKNAQGQRRSLRQLRDDGEIHVLVVIGIPTVVAFVFDLNLLILATSSVVYAYRAITQMTVEWQFLIPPHPMIYGWVAFLTGFLVRLVIGLLLVFVIMVGWNVLVSLFSSKREQRPSASPATNDYLTTFRVKVPPGHRAIFFFLGRPVEEEQDLLRPLFRRFRDRNPGWQVKLPFLETVLIINMQAAVVDFKSEPISTSLRIEPELEWEGLERIPTLYPKSKKRDTKRAEAAGIFDFEMLIGIADAEDMLNYDPELLIVNGAKAVRLYRSIANDILQPAVIQRSIFDWFHVPSSILAFGTVDQIANMPATAVTGDDPPEGFEIWKDLINDTFLKDQHGNDVFVDQTGKEVSLVAPNAHKLRVFKDINLENDNHIELVGKYLPESFVGRLQCIGFRVRSFSRESFRPANADVQAQLDAITNAKLARIANISVVNQKIDTTLGERAQREINAIGSAKSISRMLAILSEDLQQRFGLDYKPTSEQITNLIALMEHYRTIRLSENNQMFLMELDRFIPGVREFFSNAGKTAA